MRTFGLRRIGVIAALSVALLAITQIGLPATQAAPSPQTRGVPGPSAVGKRVDLRQLPPIKGDTPRQVREIPRLYPVDANTFGQMKAAANQAAAARDHKPGSGSTTSSTTGIDTLNFTQTGGWNPPDAGLAVSDSYILVAVNEAFGIYSKPTSTKPATLQNLIKFSANALFNTSDSVFDPRALYDAGSGHFVLLAVSQGSGTSSYQLAVSASSDPTGTWYVYSIPAVTGSGNSAAWADFPGLGMDGNNIYITSNQFTFTHSTFQYARILAIPKSQLYSDLNVNSVDLQDLRNPDGSTAFTVQPVNQPFATSTSTTPMYFVNALWSSGSQLVVRSVGTAGLSQSASVTVPAYTLPANAPQPGGKAIDTGDDRLLGATMDASGVIYTANTTGPTSSATNRYANAQWYSIPTSNSSSVNSGVVTNSGIAYYYPAVMPSGSSVVLEVSGSSSKQPASAFYVKGSSVNKYATGVGGYSLSSRWGDYGAAAPDPSDGSVWVLGEYAKSSSGWGTAVINVP